MTEGQRKDYDDDAVSSLSSIPKGAASRKIWERILEDWAVCRGKDVKPPVPILYTAVDFADRAKELRHIADAQYTGSDTDVGDVYRRDAAMMEYAAKLAAIRYDAKQQIGSFVYDAGHPADAMWSGRKVVERLMRIWKILANGEENR